MRESVEVSAWRRDEQSDTLRGDERLASALFGFVCHLLAAAFGVVWAFGIVILCLEADGVPPEDYEPYNRAAFSLLLTVLLAALPIAGWVTFVLARALVGSRLLSLVLAQVPTAALAALLVSRW